MNMRKLLNKRKCGSAATQEGDEMKKKNEKEFMKIIIMELFMFIISIGALYLFFKYIIFPFFFKLFKV